MTGQVERVATSRVGRTAIALVVAVGLVLSVSAFGDGRYPVGVGAGQIPPGTYTVAGGANCYWERDDMFGDIAANDFEPNPQRHIVTIEGSDSAFETSRCGDWQPLGGPTLANAFAPFPDGTWRVGYDVASNNRWVSTSATASCYWERISDFRGQLGSIIDNSFGPGPTLAVLAAGDAGFHSSGCGWWVRDTSLDPFGALDAVGNDFGGIRVGGWAQDRDSGGPTTVHIYVDGVSRAALSAGDARPDVGAHGFSGVVGAGVGTHLVCAYGINAGLGINGSLGCRSITVVGNPIGALERISYSLAGLRISGWTLDPNRLGPIDAHIYIDGTARSAGSASKPRPDIAQAFPGYGANHGYDVTVPIGGGSHTVCAYGINVGVGSNATLGCRGIVTPTAPIGAVDGITARYDVVRVRGWTLDPNTTSPVVIHVYVDGAPRFVRTASVARSDIGAAYPGYGADHGFDFSDMTLSTGTHQVCVYAINQGPGAVNPQLGCRTVSTNANPIGSVDAFIEAPGGIRVRGWAFDPDDAGPVAVRVYVDGAARATIEAGLPRPSVGATVPGAGPNRGFESAKITTSRGAHLVCVYGLNVGNGSNSTLGCRTVTVHTG